MIRTPDHRLRVFISSTMSELAEERAAATEAVRSLKLTPTLFEQGARAHPPQALYRAYLEQSHIFVAIYWESYGWIAPDMEISGIEDEYRLAGDKPKLIYIKDQTAERDPRLQALIKRIAAEDAGSYKYFSDAEELDTLVANDLALLLTEHFELANAPESKSEEEEVLSNLPALVNLFVGREEEMKALDRTVNDEGVRLVTLTGPGGIGKSRLALEFASSVASRFEHGTHLVLLLPVTDPALVPAAIARALRIQETPGIPTEEVLVKVLNDRHALLVLDSFEHVLPAAESVGELVMACPELVVLVTSRSPLNLRGEQDLLVGPLEVPRGSGTATVDRLGRYEAVRLFIDRARAVAPDFEITNKDAPAIADICCRLDGIPLAIELAAARIRLLTPEAMLARLKDRFSLLTGGWRDLPQRHRTLRGTIDWSFDLLDDNEKEMFASASVFNGGWTIDAAETVCDPEGRFDILELTASLIDKSLFFLRTDPSGEPRFSMLETIREYAGERLRETGHYDAVIERHIQLFLRKIQLARPRLRSQYQEECLDGMEGDAGNIRALLDRLIAAGRQGEAAMATWTLWQYWWLKDRLDEGMRVTNDILESTELTDLERARALAANGVMAFWQGDYAKSLPVATEALEIFRRIGDEEGVALCQLPLGLVGSFVVGPDDAFPRFEEARTTFERLGDRWGGLLARNAQVWLALGLGVEIPEGMVEEALQIARDLQTEVEYGMACGNYGSHLTREGRLEEAHAALANALEILAKYRTQSMATYTFDQTAELALLEGHPELAARLFGAADGIRGSIGAPVTPMHLITRVPLVERTAQELGQAAFQAAQSEGALLPFKVATREALEFLRAPVPARNRGR